MVRAGKPSLKLPDPVAINQAVRSTIEREIKLTVDDRFRLPAFPGTPIPRRLLISTYYDTPQYDLAHAGITLRHRVERGKQAWQLKLPLIKDRQEVEIADGQSRKEAEKRLAGEGYGRFRRGYEFRLTANSKSELRLIRDLLRQADFKPGRPFTKGRQFRQPVYGRHALERFLLLIDADDAA